MLISALVVSFIALGPTKSPAGEGRPAAIKATSQLSLTSSPNPSQSNSPFTLTATVSGSGPIPTGTVTFFSAPCPAPCLAPIGPIGTVPLDSTGKASLNWPGFSLPGSYGISATYSGDSNYSPVSNTSPFTQVVVAPPDSVAILGAGQIGNWVTSGFAANPNSSQVKVIVAPFPNEGPDIPCIDGVCPFYDFVIPPQGMLTLPFLFTSSAFGTVYVTVTATGPGQALPVVQASMVDQTNPCRTATVPVVQVSRLIAANLWTLNFPGVVLGSPPPAGGVAPHSNLVLGNILRPDGTAGGDLSLLLELFDSSGNPSGSASLTLSYGQTLLIGDVVSFLGGGTGFLGQLRVTKVSGNALMWGIVYSMDSDGSVRTVTGANLSP